MDSLEWAQSALGLKVSVYSEDNLKGFFILDKQVINLLWAGTPRIYIVYVKFSQALQEKCYTLDLTDLKPVISQSNALRMSLKRKNNLSENSSLTPVGRCCIARGESYHDRFFKEGKWQSQKVYFDMFAFDDDKPSETITQEVQEAEPKEEKTSVGKLKCCPFCGEIYPSSLEVCPFCNNKKASTESEDVDLDLS